jgi:lipoprotein-releasing system permease protein
MFRPLELALAFRFVRSREAGLFVSFVTWASLVGVALGVAALITILSVMNGFEAESRVRLLSLSGHATVFRADGAAMDGAGLSDRARQAPGVVGAAPVVDQHALLVHGEDMAPATLRGVDAEREESVTAMSQVLGGARLSDLGVGQDRVFLGRALAFQLHVVPGDEVTVMVPTVTPEGALEPRLRTFHVVGLFEAGLQEHDATLAIGALADVAAFAETGGATAIRLRYADPMQAPEQARRWAAAQTGLVVRDWTEENASYFRAVRLEKTMMTLILLLVVAVAAFNIVAMLIMVVRAKRTDIAILRTLGLSAASVVRVFLGQGLLIGWTGSLLGVVLGTSLALHVDAVAVFIERLFGFEIFDSNVYYITQIPSQVDGSDLVLIAGLSLALTLMATVYPARRAAHVHPADALRYE